MFLIRPFLLVLFLFLAVGGTTGAGVSAYYLLQDAGGTISPALTARAETLLYAVILLDILLAVIAAGIWLRGMRVLRQLDRITELARLKGIPPENRLFRMGKIGRRIALLLAEISAHNQRQARKITAMGKLLTFLTDNIDLRVVVTDVGGQVKYASDGYIEKTETRRENLIDRPLIEIDPLLDPLDIIAQLSRQTGPLQVESGAGPAAVYPIHASGSDTVYLVYIFGRKTVFARSTEKSAEGARGGLRGIRGALSRLFSRRRSGM